MKQGLFLEKDQLVYYRNGRPCEAGAIEVNGDIYYIGPQGIAAKGRQTIHKHMTNNLLRHGTYTFGIDGRLIKDSYTPPRKPENHINHPAAEDDAPGKLSVLWMYIKERKNQVVPVIAMVFFLLFYLSIRVVENNMYGEDAVTSNITASSQSAQENALPTFSEDVLLCSTAAKEEYDGTLPLKQAVQTGSPYRPFLFEYLLKTGSGELLLSTDPEFSDAQSYLLPKDETAVQIDNLYTDTTYYYLVTVGEETYTGSFHTAPSTRFVSIPGLINTRDIGGKTTLDGKTVKQGLLIRGVEMDGLVNTSYFLPTKDIPEVQETFGFVYDLDLRSWEIYNGPYASRLGVPHKFYTSPMYGEIFHVAYRDALREIFRDLANPDHYPMYLHCTYGMDRTGTIVFLLEGLLNVSQEDMVREYLLTAYFNTGLAESMNMDIIIEGLAPFPGDTLQEKIESYLTTAVGVTKEEIASIREIFLED